MNPSTCTQSCETLHLLSYVLVYDHSQFFNLKFVFKILKTFLREIWYCIWSNFTTSAEKFGVDCSYVFCFLLPAKEIIFLIDFLSVVLVVDNSRWIGNIIPVEWLTDTWYVWTNLTAWWTCTPLVDGHGNKQTIFYLPYLKILNGFIILASCSSEFSHRFFRLVLKRDLILEASWVPQLHTTCQWRHIPSMNQLMKLDIRHRHNIH